MIQSLSSFVPRLSVNSPSRFSTMKARVETRKACGSMAFNISDRQTAIEQQRPPSPVTADDVIFKVVK